MTEVSEYYLHIMPVSNHKPASRKELGTLQHQAARDGALALAAGLLQVPADTLTLFHTPDGKPVIPGISLSLTHSATVAGVLAGPPGRDIGVDIQRFEPDRPWKEMAARFLAPAETAWIGDDAARFFLLWTLKEAKAKATGLPLASLLGLDAFRVGDGGRTRSFSVLQDGTVFYGSVYGAPSLRFLPAVMPERTPFPGLPAAWEGTVRL